MNSVALGIYRNVCRISIVSCDLISYTPTTFISNKQGVHRLITTYFPRFSHILTKFYSRIKVSHRQRLLEFKCTDITVRLKTTSKQTKCWKCDQYLPNYTIFCTECKTLQSIDKQFNYFKLISVDQSYNIDLLDLKQKYRKLQTLLHPDKYSAKSKKERELSEEISSFINKAYFTLLDPLERGLYLLSLHNDSIKEGTTDVDKVFLMEIMERNEEIENETDPIKLKDFYSNNKNQLDNYISKIAVAFDANDIEKAKELLTKMKYYNTIDVKIKEIKQKRNIPD